MHPFVAFMHPLIPLLLRHLDSLQRPDVLLHGDIFLHVVFCMEHGIQFLQDQEKPEEDDLEQADGFLGHIEPHVDDSHDHHEDQKRLND